MIVQRIVIMYNMIINKNGSVKPFTICRGFIKNILNTSEVLVGQTSSILKLYLTYEMEI